MSSMLPVALKVILISAILYGYYHLVLRNRKFHRYNRYFLIATVILSLSIPFINIDLSFTTEQAESSQVIKTFRDISASAEFSPAQQVTKPVGGNQVDFTQLAAWFFVAIGLILLFRLLFTVKKLYLLYKRHRSEKIDNIVFIHTKAPGTPYSFFRWLFWNDEIEMNSDYGEKIFRHEMYHIKQNHSMDLLFMEILNIFCWFNPVYYLVKKEIRAIHEFLADEYAASDSDRNDYAELLLMQTLQTNQRLVNPFFHNLVKRRIMMLLSKKPSLQYARRILVLPVLCLLFGLFAFRYNEHVSEGKQISADPITTCQLLFEKKIKQVIKHTDTTKNPLIVVDGYVKKVQNFKSLDKEIDPGTIEKINVVKGDEAVKKYGEKGKDGVIEIFTKQLSSPAPVNPDSRANIVFTITEEPASFPGGPEKFQEYVNSKKDRMHVSYPRGDEGVQAFSDHLEVTVKFIVHEDGFLSDISASTTEQIGYDAVWLISKGPKWIPAKQNGINVSSWVKQVIKIPWNKVEPSAYTGVPVNNPYPKISVNDFKNVTPYQLLLLPEGTPVIRYSFTIDLPDGSIISIPNYGSLFNDQTKSQIQAAHAGRLLTIDNIIISENGKEKKVPSKIWYIVK